MVWWWKNADWVASAWKSICSIYSSVITTNLEKKCFQASKCVRIRNSRIQMSIPPSRFPLGRILQPYQTYGKGVCLCKSLWIPAHIPGNEFMWIFPHSHMPEIRQLHLRSCLTQCGAAPHQTTERIPLNVQKQMWLREEMILLLA